MLRTTALSAETLANVLAQSLDCVKLIGPDGTLQWMNANGLCAMEIDELDSVRGKPWTQLWPEESRAKIADGLARAATDEAVRFDAFCPTAKGAPRWWSVTISAVSDASGHPAGFVSVSRDVTEIEYARQAMEVTTAELRHRLKNTYAMIGSLINGFARGNPEWQQFAHDMQSRLISLSKAQALFSTNDAPCELSDLIPALLTPFETPNCEIHLGDIPAVVTDQAQADAIALVLGEMAVNSAKFGALAHGGSVAIGTVSTDDTLELTWDETCTEQAPSENRQSGQGHRLIQRIVTMRGGSLTIAWRDCGLVMTMRLPLIRPSSAAARKP
jgi:two-component sensor histidine kinase